MPKSKKKCGRPSKSDNFDEIEYQDEGYIATNKFSLELLQLITEMANYKILTITGPQKKDDEKQNKQLDMQDKINQKKKCLKNRKEIEKKQNSLRKQLDIKENKVFLLRNQDEYPRKYRLLNGKLIECVNTSLNNNYMDQNEYIQRNKFLNSILRVCNELNEETQMFINQLVKIFNRSDKSLKQFQEQFFESFKSSSNLDYKEIKQWNQLFEISFDEKLSLIQNEIDQFKNRFCKYQNQDENLKRVYQKRIQVLNIQQENLDQLKNIQKPDRPLQLFIRKIYCLFHKFWNLEDYEE
ncbi:unnamed protein product [Paramecium pentaurelia]|uniref:Uncharacterized protein n=1 Tax=Paramecium pentaurelia TaxID=43138 RepID=A0A8S1XLH0_9CILI|nr:unnamed protein product [Paramecium pentaurelia]